MEHRESSGNITAPLFNSPVSAGFPSPAEDYIETPLDLNQRYIKHPAATFFVKVDGESMTGAGIFPGDILIVDRALEASNGDVIIAALDGEFTVKRLKIEGKRILLLPENENYRGIDVSRKSEFEIWGVVTTVIHDL